MQFHEDKQAQQSVECSILRNLIFLTDRNSHYYMYEGQSKITES